MNTIYIFSVVSTIEPGRKQLDSETEDSIGDIMLMGINVDIVMDKEPSTSSASSSAVSVSAMDTDAAAQQSSQSLIEVDPKETEDDEELPSECSITSTSAYSMTMTDGSVVVELNEVSTTNTTTTIVVETVTEEAEDADIDVDDDLKEKEKTEDVLEKLTSIENPDAVVLNVAENDASAPQENTIDTQSVGDDIESKPLETVEPTLDTDKTVVVPELIVEESTDVTPISTTVKEGRKLDEDIADDDLECMHKSPKIPRLEEKSEEVVIPAAKLANVPVDTVDIVVVSVTVKNETAIVSDSESTTAKPAEETPVQTEDAVIKPADDTVLPLPENKDNTAWESETIAEAISEVKADVLEHIEPIAAAVIPEVITTESSKSVPLVELSIEQPVEVPVIAPEPIVTDVLPAKQTSDGNDAQLIIPETTEQMTVEEQEASVPLSTDVDADAASVVATDTAMEATPTIIPVTSVDEQMDVDESNSADSMDL